jgi:plastocyanin
VVFDDDSIDAGTLAPDTLSQPMTVAAGTWTYHCSIHPSMTGTVTVPSS